MEADGAHRPVLLREVLDLLAPRPRQVLVDATLGLGGHAEAWLRAAGEGARLIGIDLDEQNLRLARSRLEAAAPGRVRLFQAEHGQIREVLDEAGIDRVDAVLADLGISSNQLDEAGRGLSFQQDGPLDMRLDARIERTAADVVNTFDERELADLIYQLGEERYSRRIAGAIIRSRQVRKIQRTSELAEIVYMAYPAPARRGRRGVHPATRTFQALRLFVNDQLGSLERLLEALPDCLAPAGRCAVISFHSLEDRRVKRAFADWKQAGTAELLTAKPLTPGEEEIRENPRSRSAKLRAIQRIG
jgi:16S rRNA (cytosine1402-N4)-methyltransferase